MPTDEAQPNWSWLQEKLDAAHAGSPAAMRWESWLERELVELEETFSDLVTLKSQARDLKRAR